ncbi:MAG: NapC/NirT family cytochrome c [Mailhella sp.]|nr:NapC/NirT family cytochrome c [Mailhella sp.]
MEKSKLRPWKLLTLGAVFGAALVFAAIAGMRYSDSRPFCSMCHVMEQAAITHSNSPHADLSCNECHAPHNIVEKLPFKAKEGLRDFIDNIRGIDAPLRAGMETRAVINSNCISCHRNTVQGVMMAKDYCFDCHRSVAHQKKLPVSFREAADE